MNKITVFLITIAGISIVMYTCKFLICLDDIQTHENSYVYNQIKVKIVEQNNMDDQKIQLIFKHVDLDPAQIVYYGFRNAFYMDESDLNMWLEALNNDSLVGQQLVIKGRYKQIVAINNPGAENVKIQSYAYNRVGKFKFKSIEKVKPLKGVEKLYNRLTVRVGNYLQSLNKKIVQQLELVFTGDIKGILIAMIVGNKDEVSATIRNDFKQHGISHIIAISGLHIGMLYMLIQKVTSLFIRKRKQQFLVSLLLIVLYNLLIGHNVSGIRATAMLSIYYYSVFFCRPYEKRKVLLLIFCIYISIRPMDILNPGFLLSYGAVWSLFYILPFLEKLMIKDKASFFQQHVIRLFLVTISINIGTFPVMIYFFNGISISSFLVNPLVVPLVLYIYIGGLICLGVSSVSLPMAKFLSGTINIMMGYIKMIINLFSTFDFIYLRRPSIIQIIMYYAILFLIINLVNDYQKNPESNTYENINSNTYENINSNTHENINSNTHENINSNTYENINSNTHENTKSNTHKNLEV